MANVPLTMEISYERRRAIYTPRVDRPEYGILKGIKVSVRVWGCYQVADGDDVNPYFVVELASGRTTYVAPEDLQFVKEEE